MAEVIPRGRLTVSPNKCSFPTVDSISMFEKLISVISHDISSYTALAAMR